MISRVDFSQPRFNHKLSVIPEAWGLPPVLSVVALGKRLARHLAAEEKVAASTVGETIPRTAVA